MRMRLSKREILELKVETRKGDPLVRPVHTSRTLEMEDFVKGEMDQTVYFFSLFNIIVKVEDSQICVFKEDVQKVRMLSDVLKLRYVLMKDDKANSTNEEGNDFCYVKFLCDELFEKVVTFWIRSFGSGSFRIPTIEENLFFKRQCWEMGLRTSFGKIFADAYKSYVSVVASWLHISSASVRSALLEKASKRKARGKRHGDTYLQADDPSESAILDQPMQLKVG